ncbi:MAG: cupin domain-containing protein [Candidatus Thorarchaeota archaeon]|nr:cupin domain-containing protein [Candidatus Thorarchaeota archaeon]
MDDETKYSISAEIEYNPLELIDIPNLIEASKKKWQNFSLCEVNDCVVRLGVIHGEFHWHKHDHEDEFFYVIDGLLHMDLKDITHDLKPGQGFMVPKGEPHRTRAPDRTSILMVEGKTVTATGD